MTAQIIEKAGRKEYAVIPYKEFLRLQAAAEDYHALTELRKAKLDPANMRRCSPLTRMPMVSSLAMIALVLP